MFPGGMDMQQVLAQAQQLQAQMAQAQEELANARVTGTAGGGLVTATVSGNGELVDLSISADALAGDNPADTAETLADLVLAAVRDATEQATQEQARTMGPVTEGLGGLGGGLGLGGGPGGGLGGGTALPGS